MKLTDEQLAVFYEYSFKMMNEINKSDESRKQFLIGKFLAVADILSELGAYDDYMEYAKEMNRKLRRRHG